MPRRAKSPPQPPLDYIGGLIDGWRRERPDLDVQPVAVVNRVGRLAAHFSGEIEKVFAHAPIRSADFAVLANLRRAGAPFRLTQRQLMDALRLTSGTVSVRIDRLADQGLVRRDPDPDDGRSVLVTLTGEGEVIFDGLAPEHLANEARLVAALDPDEQTELARLLQVLLVEYESSTEQRPDERLGLRVAPAHVGQQRRAAVGLPDTPGLLVEFVEVEGPSAVGGIQTGDLLVRSDERDLRSLTCLGAAIARARTNRLHLQVRRGEHSIAVVVKLIDS